MPGTFERVGICKEVLNVEVMLPGFYVLGFSFKVLYSKMFKLQSNLQCKEIGRMAPLSSRFLWAGSKKVWGVEIKGQSLFQKSYRQRGKQELFLSPFEFYLIT